MQDWNQERFIILPQYNRKFHNPTFHWKAVQYNWNVEKHSLPMIWAQAEQDALQPNISVDF